MSRDGFQTILEEFGPQYHSLKLLAERLHEILFPLREGAIWTGADLSREGTDKLYDGMIRVFEDAIAAEKQDRRSRRFRSNHNSCSVAFELHPPPQSADIRHCNLGGTAYAWHSCLIDVPTFWGSPTRNGSLRCSSSHVKEVTNPSDTAIARHWAENLSAQDSKSCLLSIVLSTNKWERWEDTGLGIVTPLDLGKAGRLEVKKRNHQTT